MVDLIVRQLLVLFLEEYPLLFDRMRVSLFEVNFAGTNIKTKRVLFKTLY